MVEECDPTYARVDEVLELITKSKALHVLMVLDRAKSPLRFSDIKTQVEASATTVSRRLRELEDNGLVMRDEKAELSTTSAYQLTPHGQRLSPVMQSLFDWAENWPANGLGDAHTVTGP
ncbi:MAG: winged helix-turn-helix transcriptional regulator [Poseidonia sp.]